jgi:zinc-finger-containing domain
MSVTCDYCHRPAALVTGEAIYPHRPDLASKKFWHCEPCGAWVGCHPPHRKRKQAGTEPLGRLANAELRRAKQAAHAAFDPLWKSREMTRTEAYAWLAGAIGVSVSNMHIGVLDVDGCNAVIAAINGRKKQCQ